VNDGSRNCIGGVKDRVQCPYRVESSISADCDVISRSVWIHEVPDGYWRESAVTREHSEHIVVFTEHNGTVASDAVYSTETRSLPRDHLGASTV